MNLIHAVILGIVEGLTEFLPVSSTAHLQITSNLLLLGQTDFVKTFEIVIQFGAILAVVVLYARLLLHNVEIWKRILAAFLPTAVIGYVFYSVIKNYLLGNDSLIIWTLGLGGIIIIIFEYVFKQSPEPEDTEQELSALPYRTAVLVGLAQAIAAVPGVSRSAATIIAGRSLGMSKRAIVEFSFLLAIPTMAAAAGYDLLKSAPVITGGNVSALIVGFVVAFIAALIAIKSFMSFVRKHSFTAFGIYRIVLALLLLSLLTH
jgi:undecaprenyl-diphosphatase